MPYCNPKAPGEVQKLKLKTKIPPADTTKTEEPIIESPTGMDSEESLPEGPPQDVRTVSSLPRLPSRLYLAFLFTIFRWSVRIDPS